MSGKRVPGQVWRKLGPAPGGGKGSSGGGGVGRADERIAALMEQYRQMLRFLGEKGCLLNSVRPEVLDCCWWFEFQDVLHSYDPRSFTVPTKPRKQTPVCS